MQCGTAENASGASVPMLNDFTGADQVYIACGYTDLRKGIDCRALLCKHQKHPELQCVRYQRYKEEINEFIDELNRQAAAPHGSVVMETHLNASFSLYKQMAHLNPSNRPAERHRPEREEK